ncbi:hypothetical protein [Saccharopolyspora flava]|nr:hypothetical protein [Saccharopolyspora flava]
MSTLLVARENAKATSEIRAVAIIHTATSHPEPPPWSTSAEATSGENPPSAAPISRDEANPV